MLTLIIGILIIVVIAAILFWVIDKLPSCLATRCLDDGREPFYGQFVVPNGSP